MPRSPGTPSTYRVPNLDRALSVLELLADHPGGLKLAEITRELRCPKNSVFRVTMTLLDRGYVSREARTKVFRLSRRLLTLGHEMLSEKPIVPTALDIMRECRDEVRETVLIGTIVQTSCVVLEQVLGTHPFKFSVDLGTRLHLHVSAPGKALLAHLPEHEREALLGRLEMVRFNERTITSRRALRTELKGVRECGFSLDRAEQLRGIVCVGAPVLDRHGYPIAAIWTTGPSDRLSEDQYAEVGDIIRRHARAISAEFGYRIDS
ncbi:MAG: IclR family transcriptional regulator [Planctomycetota bacterium]|nr:IclR family transcriptional regulator [Planctomycetota bacterium]